MKKSKPSVPRPLLVLADFLTITPDDLVDYGNGIYSWGDVVYQVLTKKQMIEFGAPASHYVPYTYRGHNYRIREVGEKSSLYMKPFTDKI